MNLARMGNLEGKRQLVRPTRRWKNNITLDLQETDGSRGLYLSESG
jgi:hypothetical protein